MNDNMKSDFLGDMEAVFRFRLALGKCDTDDGPGVIMRFQPEGEKPECFCFTPAMARRVAHDLFQAADDAEGKASPSGAAN